MSDYDDAPEPEFRGPWEREQDEAEKRQVAELADLIGAIDAEQTALDRLADEDPMGFVFSGQVHEGRTAEQADAWLDSRLHGESAE